jgi:hypothetical protein
MQRIQMRRVAPMPRLLVAALSLAGAVGPSPLRAQSGAASRSIAPFSTVYVTTGTMLMDVTKLNPRFERTDLPADQRPGFFALSNDAYSIGIGGYGTVAERLTLGGEFHTADVGEESSPAGKTNQLSTTYLMGTVGYAMWTNWRVNVIPYFGVGMGSVSLTLKSRDGGPTVPAGQDPTFDEVIAQPGSLSTMKGSYVVVQPGVTIDMLILGRPDGTHGLTLGIHFSSLITPNRTKWTYGGREVFGAPDVGPTSGSIRLVFGYGGFRMGPPQSR